MAISLSPETLSTEPLAALDRGDTRALGNGREPLADLVAAPTDDAGHDKLGSDLNFVTAAWVWVAFIVTFLILRKVAWPGLADKLEERELRIVEGLKKA